MQDNPIVEMKKINNVDCINFVFTSFDIITASSEAAIIG